MLVKKHTFFLITQYNTDTHNAYTLIPMNARMQTLLSYEYLERLGRQILEIDEVTTYASLSTGTSATTKNTIPLNPGKFEIDEVTTDTSLSQYR
jgi:hypothetical protein